jgi:hypothetical protein
MWKTSKVRTVRKQYKSLPREQDCQHKQWYIEDSSQDRHHWLFPALLLQDGKIIQQAKSTIRPLWEIDAKIYRFTKKKILKNVNHDVDKKKPS